MAVGICLTCGRPFCLTHQGRHAASDMLVLAGGEHWIKYPDRCADCVREHDERAIAQAATKAADRRARLEWVASLPPMTPEALLAYVQHQVDADDGVVSFNDESFALTADPMCVATVLRRVSYPGPFKHKAYLGLPGREKKGKITGWTVVRKVPYTNQDHSGISTTGFMLTTDGLITRVNGDDGIFNNDSPSVLFRGRLVACLLESMELEILRETLNK